jgi:hypothetical protein
LLPLIICTFTAAREFAFIRRYTIAGVLRAPCSIHYRSR